MLRFLWVAKDDYHALTKNEWVNKQTKQRNETSKNIVTPSMSSCNKFKLTVCLVAHCCWVARVPLGSSCLHCLSWHAVLFRALCLYPSYPKSNITTTIMIHRHKLVHHHHCCHHLDHHQNNFIIAIAIIIIDSWIIIIIIIIVIIIIINTIN